MSIGNKIADLRKNAKLTQRELAEKLNVSDKVVSRWETGASLPDVEMMKKLSQVLGVTIAQLYDALDEDDENSDEKDNYERIWQYYDYERIWRYKRSTIISCALFCIAALLFIVTALIDIYDVIPAISPYTLVYTVMTILFVLDAVLVCGSILLQVVGAASLSSFSKTKYYRTLYNNALKKNITAYLIVCAVCIVVVVTFVLCVSL